MLEMTPSKVDKTNCCVYGCSTCRKRDKNVSFHFFPRPNSGFVQIRNCFGGTDKVDRKIAWEQALLMGKPATRFMRVCGKHFTAHDYIYASSLSSKRPRLKKITIPSENLPKRSLRSKVKDGSSKRQQRLLRRQQFREEIASLNTDQLCQDQEAVFEDNNEGLSLVELSEIERDAVNVLINLGNVLSSDKKEGICEDKSVQVKSGHLFSSFTSKIENDKHLNALTGLSSFALLNQICSLVAKFYPTARCRKLSLHDRVVLVFVRLKMSINFNVIAIFFHIAPSTCRETFNEYIQYISNVLKPCIFWPSIDECRANIPKCFRNFQSLRGIFDCMEIPVQKSKCRCCRIKTYSNYRSRNTLKFMTCVSPGGLLTFISKAYGGRASDKAIFEQSRVIDSLEPHIDSIMVDKGFLVDEICYNHFIKIERPPFIRKKKTIFINGSQKKYWCCKGKSPC